MAPPHAMKTSSKPWRTAICGLALCLVASAAAQSNTLSPIERLQYESITFSGLSFGGTYLTGDIYQLWSGAAGSSDYEGFAVPTGYNTPYWVGDSNVGVVIDTESPGSIWGTMTSLTGQDGWSDLGIEGPANDSDFLYTFIANGQWALQLNQNSILGVNDGDPFYWNLTLPGNWSVEGTGPGEYELLSYNADWTITNDFVYDPITNTTLFSLAMPSYDGSGVGVSLQLNGTAAPGPVALAPFAI